MLNPVTHLLTEKIQYKL